MDYLPYKMNDILLYYSNSSADSLTGFLFPYFTSIYSPYYSNLFSYLCQSKFLSQIRVIV